MHHSSRPHLRAGFLTSHMSKRDSSQIAKEALKPTLKIAEKALDGIPIPGAKAAVGTLLEVITGLEVGI